MINIKEVPEIELSWMAGFFDGEGSIGFRTSINKCGNKSFGRRICIVNTRRDILEIFKYYFGGSLKENTHMVKFNPNGKPTYTWSLSSNQSAYFIGMILPYLKLKSYQADLFMEYNHLVENNKLYSRKDKFGRFSSLKLQDIATREYIINAVKKANHRGRLCQTL